MSDPQTFTPAGDMLTEFYHQRASDRAIYILTPRRMDLVIEALEAAADGHINAQTVCRWILEHLHEPATGGRDAH